MTEKTLKCVGGVFDGQWRKVDDKYKNHRFFKYPEMALADFDVDNFLQIVTYTEHYYIIDRISGSRQVNNIDWESYPIVEFLRAQELTPEAAIIHQFSK